MIRMRVGWGGVGWGLVGSEVSRSLGALKPGEGGGMLGALKWGSMMVSWGMGVATFSIILLSKMTLSINETWHRHRMSLY